MAFQRKQESSRISPCTRHDGPSAAVLLAPNPHFITCAICPVRSVFLPVLFVEPSSFGQVVIVYSLGLMRNSSVPLGWDEQELDGWALPRGVVGWAVATGDGTGAMGLLRYASPSPARRQRRRRLHQKYPVALVKHDSVCTTYPTIRVSNAGQ